MKSLNSIKKISDERSNTCTSTFCHEVIKAKKLCKKHYDMHFYKIITSKLCTASEGCLNNQRKKKLCYSHLMESKNAENDINLILNSNIKLKSKIETFSDRIKCSLNKCSKVVYSKQRQLCWSHYKRLIKEEKKNDKI